MKPIYPGMTAHLSDGSPTTVVDVLIDVRTGHEQYLVLAANGLFGPDVVVPAATVWLVDDDVHLTLTPQEAAALPLAASLPVGPAVGLSSRAAHAHRHVVPGSASQ